MATNTVTIEFTNLPKEIIGADSIELPIKPGETFNDLVCDLAEKFPKLVGVLIAPDKCGFLSSNFFVVNGEMELPVMVMDKQPQPGDVLTIVSIATGG